MTSLPEHVTSLAPDEPFTFSCHPEVTCFNECCRNLELSLSPYDVLRLKDALGIPSQQFLDDYAIIEFTSEDLFPKVYLGMVDDGRGSCPFVEENGCRVYRDRPGACRTYPLGRGAYRTVDDSLHELFVLLQEPHCQGFSHGRCFTVPTWQEDQGLEEYNIHNDLLLTIYNAVYFKDKNRLNQSQSELFTMALYNIDTLKKNHPGAFESSSNDNFLLLSSCVQWLENKLF
nr:YkgJ family cysteine cluster protein [Desulfobulbaceae bacterium]